LPEPARQKLQNRANTRAQVGDLGDLVMDEMQLPY
jgi:hypothetical protein